MLQGFSLFVDVAQSLCALVPSPVVATSDNGGAATHMGRVAVQDTTCAQGTSGPPAEMCTDCQVSLPKQLQKLPSYFEGRLHRGWCCSLYDHTRGGKGEAKKAASGTP